MKRSAAGDDESKRRDEVSQSLRQAQHRDDNGKGSRGRGAANQPCRPTIQDDNAHDDDDENDDENADENNDHDDDEGKTTRARRRRRRRRMTDDGDDG